MAVNPTQKISSNSLRDYASSPLERARPEDQDFEPRTATSLHLANVQQQRELRAYTEEQVLIDKERGRL